MAPRVDGGFSYLRQTFSVFFSFPVRKEKKAVRFNALHLSFLPAGEHNAEIKA